MKDRLAIAIGITALVAVSVGLILGAWIAYGHSERQAEAMATELRSLQARTEVLGKEIRVLNERLADARALVWQAAVASWYGPGFHGRLTSSREIYDMYDMTLAHRSLPFGTVVILRFGNRYAVARINDRGPYISGRDLDLSYAVARQLGLVTPGVARVEMLILRGEGL